MTDYDYANAGFRAWWLEVWTRYVLDYGVDGFRLDVPRQDQMPLWDQIAARCAAAGRPIVIFPEHTSTFHFGQHDYIGFSSDLAGEFCATSGADTTCTREWLHEGVVHSFNADGTLAGTARIRKGNPEGL